jgi:IS5 family transposase
MRADRAVLSEAGQWQADKARDPEMHQTKKGNQWHFGMKAHFGVDSRTKLIHAVVATPANVAESTVLPELLHGQETRVWGDQAYRGQRAVIREHAPMARTPPTAATVAAANRDQTRFSRYFPSTRESSGVYACGCA